MMRIGILGVVVMAAIACGGSSSPGFALGDGGGGSSSGSGGSSSSGGGSSGTSSSGGFGGSGSGSGGSSSGSPLIYAHTDTELYSMDPTSHQITDIGPFDDGSGSTPTITDLAVDGNDNVWVNSESTVYKAALPSGGTGSVTITASTQLGTSTSFYALGFTPAGTLETGESLIAGDSKGNLYYIDQTGASPPQNLGGFGPAPGGGTYELSGDIVFYSSNGSPRGLATVRPCKSSSSCTETNDVLVEIDITAMQQAKMKVAVSSLLQQVLGSGGTGYGRLFGIGAWGSSVYAFSRASGSSSQAQLIQIDSTGVGTSLQSFSAITAGWSGAGVTTKAQVTVVQ
jgi:hypothetical protein